MFLARQPIFNINRQVYAYKLLFRESKKINNSNKKNKIDSTANIVDNLITYGIDKIAEGHRVFITFTPEFIFRDLLKLLNSEDVVVEFKEDIASNSIFYNQLKSIKNDGFMIALENFDGIYDGSFLAQNADIIEIDILNTSVEELKREIKKASSNNKILLAQNVKTEKDFELAKMMGFKLFQGYFFSEPKIIEGVETTSSINPIHFKILTELNEVEPSLTKISNDIGKDPELTHKILYTINLKKKFSEPIQTIERAVTFLGLKELTYWVTLIIMNNVQKDKPKELLRSTLLRSIFMGALGKELGGKHLKAEASLLGLLSNIDAFLNQKLEKILNDLNIAPEIERGLLEKKGTLGGLYTIILNYEKGDWVKVIYFTNKLGLNQEKVSNLYLKSLEETEKVVEMITS